MAELARTVITLKATVIPDYDVSPTSITVARGDIALPTINVTPRSSERFVLVGAGSEHPELKTTISADGRSISLHWASAGIPSEFKGTRVVLTTNCPTEPLFVVPVTLK